VPGVSSHRLRRGDGRAVRRDDVLTCLATLDDGELEHRLARFSAAAILKSAGIFQGWVAARTAWAGGLATYVSHATRKTSGLCR
jgi:hypothetical protein